jgi:HrpA-like RNA helicase
VERLLNMHAAATNRPLPKWRAANLKDVPGASPYHTVAVELSYSGLSTYGTGSAPSSAQAVAMLAMHDELASTEPSFGAFLAKLKAANITDEQLARAVELTMPPHVTEAIERLAAPVAKEAREKKAMTDGAGDELSAEWASALLGRGRCSPTDPALNALNARMRDREAAKVVKAANMQAVRKKLPIAAARIDILRHLSRNRVLVLCGTTGCGKSTQVPQYLFEDAVEAGTGPSCGIVMTQPRRISAMSIAERIAAERGEPLGETVGFGVRLDSTYGRHINVCTTGILLQTMKHFPDLRGLDYLIIDEVHDRSTECDMILALAKEALVSNPRLKVVVMSATLAADSFSAYFDNAPVIHVDGRLHNVHELFLEDLRRLGAPTEPSASAGRGRFDRRGGWRGGRRSDRDDPNAPPQFDPELAVWAIQHAVATGAASSQKSILVFLPGWKEMQALRRAVLETRHSKGGGSAPRFHCLLLHSTIDKAQQMAAFDAPPPGTIKLVLATNIAESGITIDDVGVVIDSGLVREMSTSMAFGRVNMLNVVYTSKASCTQRKGRAGRTAGGVCMRLFYRTVHDDLPEFSTPEIVRTPLETVLLRVAAMRLHVTTFCASLISPPPPRHVDHALHRLVVLGAVERPATGDHQLLDQSAAVSGAPIPAEPPTATAPPLGVLRLTVLGKWLSRIPVDAGLGKMIVLGASLGCFDAALTIAACSEQSAFLTNKEVSAEVKRVKREVFSDLCGSDHLTNVHAYYHMAFADPADRSHMCEESYINPSGIVNISRLKVQYRNIVVDGGIVADSPFTDPPVDQRLALSAGDFHHGRGKLFVDESPATIKECINNPQLLRAIIAAGVYPNLGVAYVRGGKKQKNNKQIAGFKTIRTRHFDDLPINPSSVVRSDTRNTDGCRDPFVVFDTLIKLDGKETMAASASLVSLWGVLILAASREHVNYDREIGLGTLDGWLFFHCTPQVFGHFCDLRDAVFHCIDKLIAVPNDAANRQRLAELRQVFVALISDTKTVLVPSENGGSSAGASEDDQDYDDAS